MNFGASDCSRGSASLMGIGEVLYGAEDHPNGEEDYKLLSRAYPPLRTAPTRRPELRGHSACCSCWRLLRSGWWRRSPFGMGACPYGALNRFTRFGPNFAEQWILVHWTPLKIMWIHREAHKMGLGLCELEYTAMSSYCRCRLCQPSGCVNRLCQIFKGPTQ